MANYNKNNPETIQAMFGSIAKQYDKTNGILSFQLHRYWNHQLVKSIMPLELQLQESGVDLCCGTGEIAFTFLKKTQQSCTMHLIDFCQEMLSCAQEKAKNLPLTHHKMTYIQADVQELPLENQSINFATMAYGIRNVKSSEKCLKEVYRVLKPGGVFGILELTQPENTILRFGHKFYLKTILPILGRMLTSNQDAYQYLCNSINAFIKPKELESKLLQAGFDRVQIKALHGGIATILIARKEKKG